MKKRSKIGTLLKMLGLVRPLAGWMLLAVCAGTLACLAVQMIPVLGGCLVLHGLKLPVPLSQGLMEGGLIACALLRAVLRYTEQKTNHYIAFTLLAIVRDRVFRALRRLSPAKLEGRDRGDLVALITADVELLEVFYAHTISPICIAVLTETVMCLLIGSFHPLLGVLAALAFLCVGIGVPWVVGRMSGDTGEKTRQQAGELSARVLENIRGLEETFQYDAAETRKACLRESSGKMLKLQERMSRLTGRNAGVVNGMILFFDLLMLLAAAVLYQRGAVSLTGLLIPLIALMSSFGPVTALAGLGTTLQNTVAAAGRVLDLVEEAPETEDVRGQERVSYAGAACEHVSFSYRQEPVLRDFSMRFPENRVIGISGKSGSGKSTLLRLMMRFWQTTSGEISVSGRNINQINTDNLREMESYMTQETWLFQDTIAANLRIARQDATQEELEEACRKASVHDFILSLPKGYETPVGELGDTLSGGERQRLGLARAFLHDAPLMLLDEPTSNLDSLNEAVILRSLRQETAGKTVVLVSHRPSTLRLADETWSVGEGA